MPLAIKCWRIQDIIKVQNEAVITPKMQSTLRLDDF